MWGEAVTPADDVPTTSESSHMPATATAAYHNLGSDNSKLDDYDARPRIYLSSRIAVAGNYTTSSVAGSRTASKPDANMVSKQQPSANPTAPTLQDP